MSKLLVEVCEITNVEPHPGADRLAIATVKGWKVVIKKNENNEAEFNIGDKCIYFPPNCVMPKELYDDRLKVGKYLKEVGKNSSKNLDDKRIAATRLRGIPSFGLIVKIDPNFGDDINWEIGTNLNDYFKVYKYEPPLEACDGDAERPNNIFYQYTSIENFQNYQNAIEDGTEVVFTEKIHGKNFRVGLVIDENDSGEMKWEFMAGSHSVRRRELVSIIKRSKLNYFMKEKGLNDIPKIGDIILNAEKNEFWKVNNFVKTDKDGVEEEQIIFVKCSSSGDEIYGKSDYWEPLNDNMKNMLTYIRDNIDFKENKNSIIVYGEIFGNVQDMKYGLYNTRTFRIFDIAINNKYLDYDLFKELANKFDIPIVPLLYRGPFSKLKLEEFTSGPTTLCSPEEAGKFKGREGVVVKPTTEVHYSNIVKDRLILKSISADYLDRANGTEFH
jgi:hypothetical protein